MRGWCTERLKDKCFFIIRGGPVITTVETGRPLDIWLRGEGVVLLAGESHVPLVEVRLEPVVVRARVADVEDSLAVGWRVVGVPLELQVVLAGGDRGLHTVRP